MMHLIPLQYLNQKRLIISGAVLMSLVACLVFGLSRYNDMQVELEDREQALFVNQKNVRKLSSIRQQIKQQKQQVIQFERALLKGQGQDKIISTMQIQVQAMLTSADLEPESLRPVTTRETSGAVIQSAILKLRISGTFEQFNLFLATIYKADTFYQVEGLTIKPFKQDQLKIYMDLRGYYQISALPDSIKHGGK
jgi:hypothetical protein